MCRKIWNILTDQIAEVKIEVQVVVICPWTFWKSDGGAKVWANASASKSHASPSTEITMGQILASLSSVYTRC